MKSLMNTPLSQQPVFSASSAASEKSASAPVVLALEMAALVAASEQSK